MRSVKRVAKRVAQGSNRQQRAFESIGYAIPRATTEKAVDNLFDVLGGTKPLAAAAALLPQEDTLTDVENTSWELAKDWVDCWKRPKHLGTSTCAS